MKKLLLGLAIMTIGAASQASQVFPLTAHGAKADAIIDSLVNAQAKHRQGREMSAWNVSALNVEYTPRGFVWSQGTFKDEVSGVTLNPITSTAHDIFSALLAAGVPESYSSVGGIGTSYIEAKSISCVRGYNIGSHSAFSQCEIEL